MIIRESLKHFTKEELTQIRQLNEELTTQFEEQAKVYEKCRKSGENANENPEIKKYRLANRELSTQIKSLYEQGQTHFIESRTDSELIDYAYKILDYLTFEDVIDYLSIYEKPEWITDKMETPEWLFAESLGCIYGETDFGLVMDYFDKNITTDGELYNHYSDLVDKAENLAKGYQAELTKNLANLADLFAQAQERRRKKAIEKAKDRTHTPETDIQYQPRTPSKYMSLSTSMYSQEAYYALSRARANQLGFNFDEPLEQGGYKIIPIEDKKLGLKGLALGYQKTTNPKKSAKQKKKTHPIFVLQNADIIESKHNYNPRKLYCFILDKLFNNDYLREGASMPSFIDITTKELLDNGVFNSRKEAIDGINESIIPLTSLSLAEFNKDNGTIKGIDVLFPSIKQREEEKSVNTYRIFFQSGLNYLGIFNQFTPCPNYIYRLPNRAGTLLYKLFTQANMNKDRFLDGKSGKLNIPLTTVQDYLDLPSLESVSKSRKENERILKPIQKAIAEITQIDKEMYPNEPIIKLTLSNREGLSAKEYIQKGYLTLEIKSDYILKKYREITTDHEHKKEVTRKIIARNKRTKEK